jgi:hypothetical protein
MNNSTAVRNLEIHREGIQLERGNSTKKWHVKGGFLRKKFGSVEQAALEYYTENGWTGDREEGFLLQNIIKAALVKRMPLTFKACPLKSVLSGWPDGLEDSTVSPRISEFLDNISLSNVARIKRNYRILAKKGPFTYERRGIKFEKPAGHGLLDYHPNINRELFVGLYKALGTNRLRDIAERMAKDPESYGKGWPDLTLWRGSELQFKEIKAPGDRLQNSQKKLIKNILLPLGYPVSVVDVAPALSG